MRAAPSAAAAKPAVARARSQPGGPGRPSASLFDLRHHLLFHDEVDRVEEPEAGELPENAGEGLAAAPDEEPCRARAGRLESESAPIFEDHGSPRRDEGDAPARIAVLFFQEAE